MPSKRKAFPKQVRFAVWEHHCGKVYSHKCSIHFCSSIMKVSDFEVGHIVAHAKGGEDRLSNLMPICNKCNKSMGTMSIPDYNESLGIPGGSAPHVKEEINKYMNSGFPDFDHSTSEPLIDKPATKKSKSWFCCFKLLS